MNSFLSRLLVEASPSPLQISQEDYLDIIYGPTRAVIIDHPAPVTDLSLRFFGDPVPKGTMAYSTIPIKSDGLDFKTLTRQDTWDHFDWCFASVCFDTNQELEGLVQDIVEQTLPVISVLSLAGKLLQLVFKVDADSHEKWKHNTRKLRSKFRKLTVIPDPLMWASPSMLPSDPAGVTLLYFNPGLTV